MSFLDLLWASLEPDGVQRPTSSLIAKHLLNSVNLIMGQSLDFQPAVNDPVRAAALISLVEQLDLQAFIPDIIRKLVATGEVLLWLRLTPQGFRFRYYHYGEFIPYFYPETDNIRAALIRYKIRNSDGAHSLVRLLIDNTGSFYEVSETSNSTLEDSWEPSGKNVVFTPSSFNFLPLYLIRNRPVGQGKRSCSDYAGLESEIVNLHEVTLAISSSVRKYCRQSILTNIPRSTLFKGVLKDTSAIASAGYKLNKTEAPKEEVAEYIGVEGEERDYFVQPISWNPIGTDQVNYVERWRKELSEAIGFLESVGGDTVFETRTIMALPQSLANRKAKEIFDNNLCIMLRDCLRFQVGLGQLAPVSDDRVVWRSVALMPPTIRENLDQSIVTRNLSEQGVGESELLKLMFPDKTTVDIERITGGSYGIPYRKIEKTLPLVKELLELSVQYPNPIVYNLINQLTISLEESLNYGVGTRSESPVNPGYTNTSHSQSQSSSSGVGDLGEDSLKSAGESATPASSAIPTDNSSPYNDFTRSFSRISQSIRSGVAGLAGSWPFNR